MEKMWSIFADTQLAEAMESLHLPHYIFIIS